MARTSQPAGQAPADVTDQAAAAAMAATDPPQDEWAALPAAVPMPAKKAAPPVRPNVLETVPDPIRERLEQSLALSCKAKAKAAASSAKRPRIDYDWQLQPVSDVDQGKRFIGHCAKYAKYRPTNTTIPHRQDGTPDGQITVRTGDPLFFIATDKGYDVAPDAKAEGAFLAVRFSARPFENRNDTARLPGSA